jgi:hypothetical protein
MKARLAGKALALALVAAALTAQAEPPGARYERIVAEARAARQAQDYPVYLDRVRQLAALLPGHSTSHYSLARGQGLGGDRAAAVAALGRLADLGYAYDAAADPAFEPLRGDPAFTAVASRLAANRAVRGSAGASIALGLEGQQPEGVATIAPGSFLVGTLRGAVYRVDAGAAPRELARAGASIVGLRPDPASGTFLACVSDMEAGRSSVQRRRLADGSLVADYPLPGARTFCNDVALVPGGFVATDSTAGLVYRLRGDRLEALAIEPLFFPNGIAADPAGRHVYVAHGNGILAVDLASGAARNLADGGALLGGIDGMIWHDGSLYVMQNVVAPARLLKVTPSPDGSARVEPVLSGHASLAGATTVAIDGNDAVILSQTGIPNGTPPDAPILLRVPL